MTTENSVPAAPESPSLADLITPTPDKPGRVAETLQRAQLDSHPRVEKVKEAKKKPPSSLVRTRWYALEVRILVEISPGVYSPLEDESYSADFVQDNLNLAYPGCTGVFLAELGLVIAFYGKKGSPQAGLSVEQGMEACQILGNITSWMGQVASIKVKAISLDEADELIRGMKRLEKESLRKVRLELCQRLSALQLGQNNTTLSASAKPFIPLATSSRTGVNGNGVDGSGIVPPLPLSPAPPRGAGIPCRPLMTSSSEDEGTTTDGTTTDSSVIPSKRKSRKKGSRGKKGKKGLRSRESGSETYSTTTSGGRSRKKAGVTNKIQIPEFTGTADNPERVAEDFRRWARVITFYRDYYEDEFLMSQIIGVLKGDTADVFDYTRRKGKGTKDLGVILQRMCNHYCDTLTFQEQRNFVENMNQGPRESAADFLVRVSGAVESLARDFKGTVPQEEFDTLLYDVSFNGVNEDIRHVLDSEIARHGDISADRMYDAVKTHEAYIARNKCLGHKTASPTGSSSSAPTPAPRAPIGGCFKPRFQRPTARVAVAVEDLEPSPDEIEYEAEGEEGTAMADPSSSDSGGLYIPDLLGEAPDGNWALNVRMAQAIKAEEARRKKFFACQSPDHFIRDCPAAKNGRRPPQPRGPSKNNPAPATAKGKMPPSPADLQVQVAQPPPLQQNAPGK